MCRPPRDVDPIPDSTPTPPQPTSAAWAPTRCVGNGSTAPPHRPNLTQGIFPLLTREGVRQASPGEERGLANPAGSARLRSGSGSGLRRGSSRAAGGAGGLSVSPPPHVPRPLDSRDRVADRHSDAALDAIGLPSPSHLPRPTSHAQGYQVPAVFADPLAIEKLPTEGDNIQDTEDLQTFPAENVRVIRDVLAIAEVQEDIERSGAGSNIAREEAEAGPTDGSRRPGSFPLARQEFARGGPGLGPAAPVRGAHARESRERAGGRAGALANRATQSFSRDVGE